VSWFGYGILFGSYFAILAVVEQLGHSAGYSSSETGVFGFVILGASIFGQGSSGLLDKFSEKHKLILCGSFLLSALSCILFLVSMSVPDNSAVIVVTCIAFGFFVGLSTQVMLALSLEVSFPVPEGTVANIMISGMQLMATLYLALITAMEDPVSHSMTISSWITATSICIMAVPMLFFKGKLKRMEVEQTHSEH